MTSHLDQRSARWLTSPPPAAPSPWKDNVFTYRLTYAPSNMIVNGEIIYWYAPGSTVCTRGGRQHHRTTFPSHADVCCSCARRAASLTRYAWCTDLIPCKNMTAEQVGVGEYINMIGKRSPTNILRMACFFFLSFFRRLKTLVWGIAPSTPPRTKHGHIPICLHLSRLVARSMAISPSVCTLKFGS